MHQFMKPIAALAAMTAMSACLGGSSGGGGGGAGGGGAVGTQIDAFDAAFADAIENGAVPTSDMPTSGSASFSGEVKIDALDANGDPSGTYLGDTSFDIAFGEPPESNTDATISNLRGIDPDGNEVSIAGELTSDYWEAETSGSAGGVTSTETTVAGQTVRAGALGVTVAGELEDDAGTFEASVLLGGTFFGSGAEALGGPAVLNLWENGAPNAAGGTGTHYATRD